MNKFWLLTLILLIGHSVLAQKVVTELTLVYDAQIASNSTEPNLANALDGSTNTLYLKGTMSRMEMVSALFSSTTIFDSKLGTAVVLKEVSGQKVLIRMNANNWKEKNRKYEDIQFRNTGETKLIAGYNCQKAIALLKDSKLDKGGLPSRRDITCVCG
jgi:hypothetical protein